MSAEYYLYIPEISRRPDEKIAIKWFSAPGYTTRGPVHRLFERTITIGKEVDEYSKVLRLMANRRTVLVDFEKMELRKDVIIPARGSLRRFGMLMITFTKVKVAGYNEISYQPLHSYDFRYEHADKNMSDDIIL